ncbi:putative oxidoreductase CipA [Mollisia scopiformis]|uniref:Putative oxidoreductase CipA n=1 Tax=Mollisia scopiformis TaxID=149040 RepID=A0A194WSQ2_MOLSC|nr:putative oxidoreductase CipA [Mollisia scopiformis]KUJ10990.1 putative oxidoreductase CipA [Mollisia scopiformis]
MAQQYAKDQPAGFVNRIERVAIVGIGGRIGSHFAEALLKTGKHTVTALVRAESKSVLPNGVKAAPINYDDEETLVAALQGQQFLAITLSVSAPPDAHSKLVKAAAKAGVPYVMPNIYGSDVFNERLMKDRIYDVDSRYKEIESLGVSSYVILVCGFWYEWSLACPPPWFGFDVKNKKVTFFDDGKTRINVSTWLRCGSALAGLLSLKELPEDENDKSPTVSKWKNKALYIDSFKVSQRDMLDSIHRITGTTDKDWEIDSEPSITRYENGKAEMKSGVRTGLAKQMYSRIFFQNGDGDYESTRGLDNELLGLPKDDLDEATKRTLDMVESGWSRTG